MKRLSIFEFSEYKQYLAQEIEIRSLTQKGQKSKLAAAIGCHAGYLSKVLNTNYDLSLEQAQLTNRFFGHTPNEARYFLNLVSFARAGTSDLRLHFQDELSKQKKEFRELKNRISIGRELSEEAQAKYYSSWHFAAIHICISLEFMQTKEQVAKALHLSEQLVNEALEFLAELKILEKKDGFFKQGEVNLFLDKSSPFITQHHTNWRVKCLQVLSGVKANDLHYSSLISCGENEIAQIREALLKCIEEIRTSVRTAGENQKLYCYTLDLFDLIN